MRARFLALALAACALSSAASAQSGDSSILVVGETGYLLDVPQLVAAPVVIQAEWSPDSRHLLLVSTQIASSRSGRTKIDRSVFDFKTKQLRRLAPLGFEPSQWAWNTACGRLLLADTRHVQVFDLVSGQLGELPSPSGNESLSGIDNSPDGRFVLAVWSGEGSSMVAVLGPDNHWRRQNLPYEVNPLAIFDERGGAFLFAKPSTARDGQTRSSMRLELATMNLESVTRAQLQAAMSNARTTSKELVAISEPFGAGGSVTDSLKLSVGSGRPAEKPGPMQSPLFVAVGSMIALSPDLSKVAYVTSGALFVREFLNVSRAEIDQARLAAERTEALNKGKQVALAMIMFAADNDDKLPTPETWAKDVEPYLKDSSILSGFVLTYKGPLKLSEIASPAETELGEVRIDGGRAVVYADGHVKWEPSK